MPKPLLQITHLTQARRADCVAACAKMILDYIGKPVEYDRLLALLQIEPDIGTRASNILKLIALGVDVLYTRGTLNEIHNHLLANHPCITFVNTGELPYWDEAVGHAIVVAGIDDSNVYVNDPAFNDSPKTISHGDFLLAWLEADEFYALIRRR